MVKLNKYIDHTILAANATEQDIKRLCMEAKEYQFYAVCVNSCYVNLAKTFLMNSSVKIAATIGFPLGASSMESKILEAKTAISEGANEIDMVMNIGYFKDQKFDQVENEIQKIKEVIGDAVLKVIIETCYLTDKEIKKASELVMKSGGDYVKTSTGFGDRGASLQDVKLMKQAVGQKIKIKASGGIRDAETAREYIELGVDRIGTSSGIKIIS